MCQTKRCGCPRPRADRTLPPNLVQIALRRSYRDRAKPREFPPQRAALPGGNFATAIAALPATAISPRRTFALAEVGRKFAKPAAQRRSPAPLLLAEQAGGWLPDRRHCCLPLPVEGG